MFNSSDSNTKETEPARKQTRVIAVASGKGGVGKTSVAVNLGLALQQRGKEVLILDADMGMANVDVILGLSARYHLVHVLAEECQLEDALLTGPEGISVLPGSSGIDSFIDLEMKAVKKLISLSGELENKFDIILLDIGAGVHSTIVNFIRASDEVIVVLTPEPTAIMDAYSLIKILSSHEISCQVNLLVNQIESEREGKEVASRIKEAIENYLNLDIKMVSHIPYDIVVKKAVRKQNPLLTMYPEAKSSRAFKKTAATILDEEPEGSRGMKGFVYRLLGFFK